VLGLLDGREAMSSAVLWLILVVSQELERLHARIAPRFARSGCKDSPRAVPKASGHK
jgi:hypothetical protein